MNLAAASRDRNPPGQTAILYNQRALTYSGVAAMVNRAGNGLCGLGVAAGDRVLLLLRDTG